jgi:hypothetical protein
MPPEIIFQIHLVLGYVAWLLCFGVYVWPRLKSMDRVEAQRAIGTLHSFRFFGLVFIVPGNERGCSSANSYRHHEGHAEPIEIVVGAPRFLIQIVGDNPTKSEPAPLPGGDSKVPRGRRRQRFPSVHSLGI